MGEYVVEYVVGLARWQTHGFQKCVNVNLQTHAERNQRAAVNVKMFIRVLKLRVRSQVHIRNSCTTPCGVVSSSGWPCYNTIRFQTATTPICV
jgi:hypothetical protein